MSHSRRCSESGHRRNLIDAARRAFKKVPRALYPRFGEPVGGCHAGAGMKSTSKGSFTHYRPIRHIRYRNRLIKSLEKALEHGPQRPTFSTVDRSLQKLRLPPLSMRRNDKPARHLVGDVRSEISANQVKTKIQSRRAAGRRQNLPLVDIEHLRIHPHLGKATPQRLGVTPMGSRPLSIKQSRGRKRKRPRTY